MPFTRAMANPEVEGREWVQGLDRPVILAANHVSHADTPLLLYALPDRVREQTVVAAAEDYWYQRPWLGRAVALWLNTFPFSRTGGPQAVLHHSSLLLKSGWNLLIYPEGTRSPHGELQEFRPGIGFLAIETHTPVVPMHVQGSHRIMPKGRSYPLPAPVRVRIGKPLTPARGEGSRAFTERIEGAVRALREGRKEPEVVGGWIDRWRAMAPPER
jgi:1-acyl-sn-glycerol-3-phosphate acyltransferase